MPHRRPANCPCAWAACPPPCPVEPCRGAWALRPPQPRRLAGGWAASSSTAAIVRRRLLPHIPACRLAHCTWHGPGEPGHLLLTSPILNRTSRRTRRLLVTSACDIRHSITDNDSFIYVREIIYALSIQPVIDGEQGEYGWKSLYGTTRRCS